MKRAALLTAALLVTGCAGNMPQVRGLHDTLRARIHEAKFLGGISCSPLDLAQAQTAYRFASLEINQGDLARAEDYIKSGLGHADRAVERGIGCNDRGLPVMDNTLDPWPDQDGDGVADAEDSCPYALEDVDEYQDRDGCPEPDNDLDGRLDRDDACPNEPEDVDGFKDEDGCPDPDNDNDGVADDQDQCPDGAETINGFEDDDGCPDFRPQHLNVTPERLEPKEPLVFADGMGLLLAHSHPALREVVQLMTAQPDVKLRYSVTGSGGHSVTLKGRFTVTVGPNGGTFSGAGNHAISGATVAPKTAMDVHYDGSNVTIRVGKRRYGPWAAKASGGFPAWQFELDPDVTIKGLSASSQTTD